MKCPNCGRPLREVSYPTNSLLNFYQWRAMRAGDFYCEVCPGDNSRRSGYRYFWASELTLQARVRRSRALADFWAFAKLALQAVAILAVLYGATILIFCL